LTSLNQLDRRSHIEPFITSLTTATNSVTGDPITVADRIRRIHAVGNFLAEITEWGWDDAPPRRLIFRTDLPRPPRFLPRYLPVDADRKLTAALSESPYRLAADALLITDGGRQGRAVGRFRNLTQPLRGAEHIAAFVAATARESGVRFVERELNGQPALVFFRDGEPVGALLLAVAEGKVQRVFFHADRERLRFAATAAASARRHPASRTP